MIESEFNKGTSLVKVSHWACCKEEHQQSGFHYHCCVKLTGVKKWLSVENSIMSRHGISVNFSDNHNHYIYAYRYVCKTDSHVLHSTGHPDLSAIGSPKGKNGTATYRENCRKRRSLPTDDAASSSSTSLKSKKCKRRLSNLDVSDYITKHDIHNQTELFSHAEARKQEGEVDLASNLFSRSEKSISEIIGKTWLLKTASKQLQQSSVIRIAQIEKCAQENCFNRCNGNWFESALQVLKYNNINLIDFAASVYQLLEKGRGKHRNMMLIGPSNSGKTFMFKPLKLIFENAVFENPSNDKYAWIGAEKAQVILLQDFRYTKEVIAWHSLLLLLDGETVKLPAPKNYFSADIVIDTDVPIFATSKCEIVYKGPFNTNVDRETEMMANRWNVYKFKDVSQQHH